MRLARQGTAAHVEEIVRRYRKLSHLQQAADAAHVHRSRELRYRWDDDGSLVLHARLPPEQGALVLQALHAASEALRAAHEPPGSAEDSAPPIVDSSAEDFAPSAHDSCAEDSPRRGHAAAAPEDGSAARRADALGLIAETLLARGPSELAAGERHRVVVHVDASVLTRAAHEGRAELEHGPALAPETVRRLCCDSSLVVLAEDARGKPLDLGRKTRAVSPALRRALDARDHGCRFPGCTNKRFTDAHHIEHWANGGKTKLDNLALLCRLHHRLVHEGGFMIERTPRGLVWRTPEGRIVEQAPKVRTLAADPVLALMSAQKERGITPRTIVPSWMGEKPDYEWIAGALVGRQRSAEGGSATALHALEQR